MIIKPFQSVDFRVNPKSVFLGELVGKGNFSKVFKGLYLGKMVAIKKQEITDDGLERYLLNELAVLRFCEHPHIVKFIGASRPNEKTVWSITEYIPGGDLKMLINSNIDISWAYKVDILWKSADALEYLHGHNIIHRDIKTDNIMLDLDLKPKLIDLGFAREVEPWDSRELPTRTMTCLGTDEYMAPEVTFAMPYHFPADVFSFGLTMLEVCTRKVPKRSAQNGFCLEWDNAREEMRDVSTPQSLRMLIEQAAADEGTQRCLMSDVVEWLEDLAREMKSEYPAEMHLNENDILKRIQARWQEILQTGDDPHANTKIDPSDLEVGFLASDVPDDRLNEHQKLRRQSINRVLQQQALVPIDEEEEDEEVDERTRQQVRRVLNKTNTNLATSEIVHPAPADLSGPTSSTAFKSTLGRSNKTVSHTPASNSIGNAGWNLKISGKGQKLGQSAKLKGRPYQIDSSGVSSTTSFKIKAPKTNVKRLRKKNKAEKSKSGTLIEAGEVKSKEKCGYVQKKNNFGFTSWVKEFLVLTEEGLIYFKNEERTELKGALLFMDMVHPKGNVSPTIEVSIAQAGKPFCFQILTRDRKIYFQGQTATDKNEWVEAINKGYHTWESTMKG